MSEKQSSISIWKELGFVGYKRKKRHTNRRRFWAENKFTIWKERAARGTRQKGGTGA